jgi:pentose-5-phosphate-3-epimerase
MRLCDLYFVLHTEIMDALFVNVVTFVFGNEVLNRILSHEAHVHTHTLLSLSNSVNT